MADQTCYHIWVIYTYKYNSLDVLYQLEIIYNSFYEFHWFLQVYSLIMVISYLLPCTMMIAMDKDWSDSNDHDPIFGVSDG